MNFNSIPNFSSMTPDELVENGNKYFKLWKIQKKRNQLYQDVVAQLTDKSVDDFVQAEQDGSFTILEDNILTFKTGLESRSILNKLKNAAETSNNKIRELEDTTSFLQRELQSNQIASSNTIKELQTQLTNFRESDPTERRAETFRRLFERRKRIPVKDVQLASNTQSYLLSQLFSSEYISSSVDGKDVLFQEQREVELNIIESCIALLRSHFESLPTGIVRLDRSSIAYDISLILDHLQESRNRLSYIIGEKAFVNILYEHIREVGEILNLFNGRSYGKDELFVTLSPHEKGLLFYKDNELESYMHCYEKSIDLQKRLMVCSKSSNKIVPFKGLEDFPSSFLYCQMEDVVKIVLLTSKPLNNIVFIPLKDSIGPDPYSFFLLDSIIDDKRTWKLDSHLLFTLRLFIDKVMKIGSKVFRQFYKDIFGHNEYIVGFEQMIESKGFERWKQIKILYENMCISSDEYMMGEIMRKVIRNNAPMYPKEGVDCLPVKTVGDVNVEFRKIRERWKQGLPAFEDEPEEHLSHCFSRYRNWQADMTKAAYYSRWRDFLKQEKYYEPASFFRSSATPLAQR